MSTDNRSIVVKGTTFVVTSEKFVRKNDRQLHVMAVRLVDTNRDEHRLITHIITSVDVEFGHDVHELLAIKNGKFLQQPIKVTGYTDVHTPSVEPAPIGPRDLRFIDNIYTCPVPSCSWHLAPNGRCPDHGQAAIHNPHVGRVGGDVRVQRVGRRFVSLAHLQGRVEFGIVADRFQSTHSAV